MAEIKTQAIVIKSTEYKESGRALTLFSIDHGLMYAKIQGVAKPKAKLAFAAQTFCFGEYVLVEKYGYTVTNCTQIENFYDLSADFDKFVAGSGVLEIVSVLARQGEGNPQLFLLMLKALKMLTYTKAQPLAVVIKFLIEALKNAGFGLELQRCVRCKDVAPIKERFSFALGGRVCSLCADGESVPIVAGEVAVLKNIDAAEFEDLTRLKFLNLDNVVSALKILIKYFFDKTEVNLSGLVEYL